MGNPRPAWRALRAAALLPDFHQSWRSLVPVILLSLAVGAGMLNLLRSRGEVFFAHAARRLIVLSILFWLFLPIIETAAATGGFASTLPRAWGAIRFLGPLLLALDGGIAFTAITVTRSEN